MASEIRVDKINSLSGVGTVTLSPTGVDIAGITTAATLKATTGIVTTLTATTGIVTTFEATIGNITTLRAPTGIVTTLTTNTLTANSTTKVGSGITLSPDGDIFTTGITTFTDDVQFIGDSGISSITYDKSENQLNFVDNAQARFGTGADLKIFHTGDHSLIRDDGTGSLLIQGSQIAIQNPSGSETMAQFIQDNAVVLYHNNVMRLTVTGAGISVSQTSGGFSEFRHGGGQSGIRIAGPAGSSGANLVFANNHNNTMSDEWAIQLQGSTDDLLFMEAGPSGNEKLRIQETGGISFNGDTATANALDDYEQGTWTPVIADNSGNTSSFGSVTHASYTKIGNSVRLSMRAVNMQLTGLTSSDPIYITGLPFNTTGYNYSACWLRTFSNGDWAADKCMVFGYFESNKVFFQGDNGATGGVTLTVNDCVHNQTDLFFSVVYLAS